MATVNTLKTNALRMYSPTATDQLNFSDDELFVYFNEILNTISEEMADSRLRAGLTNTTLSFVGTNVQSLPSDFIAEDRIYRNGTDDLLTKATQQQINRWEDDTNTGDLMYYYIMGTSIYVNPIADGTKTVKLYYYPRQSIDDNANTIPWGGIFDQAIQWHVLRRMHARSEMFGFASRDENEYARSLERAWARVYQRDDFKVGFQIGWNNNGRRKKNYLGVSDTW